MAIALADRGKLGQLRNRASEEAGYAGTGHELAYTWAQPILAHGFARMGKMDIALGLIAQAALLVEKNQERYVESEVHRIKGELILLQPKAASGGPVQVHEAEQSLTTAIAIARKHGAKSLELRAAASFAELLRDTNRRDEARATLSETFNWFTEGFDTADLKDAKALLDELSS